MRAFSVFSHFPFRWGLIIIAGVFLWSLGPAISHNYVALRMVHALRQPDCQVCWHEVLAVGDQLLDFGLPRAEALQIRIMIMAGEPRQAAIKFKSMVGVSVSEKDVLRTLLIEALSRQAHWSQVNDLLAYQRECNSTLANKLTILGQAYEIVRDDKNAEAAFVAAFHTCSQEEIGIRALLHLGERAARQGRLTDAVRYYRLLVTTSHVSSSVLADFANLLLQMNAFDEALIEAERSVNLDPGYLGGYAMRGMAHYFRGELGPAIADLEYVAQRTPTTNKDILYVLANAYLKSGEKDTAKMKLEELLESDPNFQPAYDLLNTLKSQSP